MNPPEIRPSRPHDNPSLEPKTVAEVASAEEGLTGALAVNAEAAGLPASSGARQRIAALGVYELGPRIGAGAMGSVYRAWQPSKKRSVAIKILKPHLASDPLFLQRFLREAEVMSQLNHPNIVRCYSMGRQHGRYYIAMELVEGRTLGEWLIQLGKLSVADALYVARAVARALQHAHQNGLIHRDVKPSNLLITNDGRIKLADMGLARSVLDDDSEATQAGHGAGTPIYVAPEQARDARDADPRSDLYSLGCMFYQMLTGEAPFQGRKSLDVILAKLAGRYVPLRERMPELPLELDEILCRLLACHPDERYQSASDLLGDLEHWDVAGSLSFQNVTKDPATVNEDGPPGTEADLSATANDPQPTLERRWYVLSKGEGGEWVTRRLTTTQVLELMKAEQFARTASASLFRGSFRPLAEIAEFAEAVPPDDPVAPRSHSTPAAPSSPRAARFGLLVTLVTAALAIGFLMGLLLMR